MDIDLDELSEYMLIGLLVVCVTGHSLRLCRQLWRQRIRSKTRIVEEHDVHSDDPSHEIENKIPDVEEDDPPTYSELLHTGDKTELTIISSTNRKTKKQCSMISAPRILFYEN